MGQAQEHAPTSAGLGLRQAELDAILVQFLASESPEIPALPQVMFQLQDLVRSDDFSADDLAKVVQTDQVLAATVLKYANRTAIMRNSEIVSLRAAIARIGAHELVTVAFGSTLSAIAAKPGPLLHARTAVWQQAVVSALVCQHLARPYGVFREVGFLAGLLHDFGKVIALAALEAHLLQQDDGHNVKGTLKEWLALIEPHHVELGIVAAAKWSLPEPLPSIIATHHDVDGAGEHQREVKLLQLSDDIAQLLTTKQRLTMDDLDALHAVAASDVSRADVERTLSMLPGAVASFTSNGQGLKKNAPNAVVTPEVEPGDDVSGALDATIEKDGNEIRAQVRNVSFDGFTAFCKVPMPENFIAQVTLEVGGRPLVFFGNLLACVPERRGFLLTFRPFCMNDDVEVQWFDLVRQQMAA